MKRETPDIFALPVHPAADVFPMLPEDELEELAESIKTQGLLNSIVVQSIDGKLVLVDGRNRREACRRAGVEPTYMLLDGQDATAYVLSANINRRHMTKGQRAMAVAMIYPDDRKGGRGKSDTRKYAETSQLSMRLVQQARTVLRHTPDATPLVISGALSLDMAYKNAQDLVRAAEGEQGVMRNLRAKAPDLADQVVEGTLTLSEASAAFHARQEKEITDRRGTWLVLNSGMTFATAYGDRDFPDMSGHWDEFSASTRYKLPDVIAALEKLHCNLPKILASLRKNEV
jgi:hypothetical protein